MCSDVTKEKKSTDQPLNKRFDKKRPMSVKPKHRHPKRRPPQRSPQSQQSQQRQTRSSEESTAVLTPDNSQQKIYWAFNDPNDLDDGVINNYAPNATGEGIISGNGESSIVGQALNLGADQQITSKINALDMRDGGISLSLWVATNSQLPEISLSQIVDDALLHQGEDEYDDINTDVQLMRFNAFSMIHGDDKLTISLTRPNAADDSTNDGTASVVDCTIQLNGVLNSDKPWHHLGIIFSGEVDGSAGAGPDLIVMIDGLSFAVTSLDTSNAEAGETLSSPDDYYQNADGEDIPASVFTIKADSTEVPALIDEVRLIKGLVSSSLMSAFGASRHTSGEPLIVWNSGSSTNLTPIHNVGDSYDPVFVDDVETADMSYVLNGDGYLASDPQQLFIKEALTVQGWFKPDDPRQQVMPLFDVDLSHYVDYEGVEFKFEQGLSVLHYGDINRFKVNIMAADIARREITSEADLIDALEAVITNTIPNQKFQIVIKDDIALNAPLPSLLGDAVTGAENTLAPGTELTLESVSQTPLSISGNGDYQILVIDACDCVIRLKNLELKDGLAAGESTTNGAGAGLGAGGALFIASGEVYIDNVIFSDNVARGGSTETENDGTYGDGGWVPESGNSSSGVAGGNGGEFNDTGDEGYYALIGEGGAGGAGGTGSYDESEEGVANSGSSGSAGGFGYGGGQGGGGQGGSNDEKDDSAGGGGSGGSGGFGAGGGGGGGAGGQDVEHTTSGGGGGSGGDSDSEYINAGSGESGGTSEGAGEDGKEGGHGGVGAGLGGAIFIADQTDLTENGSTANVTIYGNCVFSNNYAYSGGDSGDSLGDAICFESERNYGNSGSDDGFPDEGITSDGEGAVAVQSQKMPVVFSYPSPSNGLSDNWQHIAACFKNGYIPQIYLDGIPQPGLNQYEPAQINNGFGFLPSSQGIFRCGHVASIDGYFAGALNGLKLFDRSLTSSEIFADASANFQRLIIQLDNDSASQSTAEYLYNYKAAVTYNTDWVTLFKDSVSEVVQSAGRNWDTIKDNLGDGVIIELVGCADGFDPDIGYTDKTKLSGYTPQALTEALQSLLPRGLPAAEVYVFASGLIDVEGFEQDELAQEQELTDETQPATLHFSTALINADFCNKINYGPLMRINEDADQLEFQQAVADQWVLYEEINEQNPVLQDISYKDRNITAIITTIVNIGQLHGKFKEAKKYLDIDKNLTSTTETFRQLPFDETTEDLERKTNKSTSAADKSRAKAGDVHDVVKTQNTKGVKLYFKDADRLTTGLKIGKGGYKLASNRITGAFLSIGATAFDSITKHSNLSNPIFGYGQNHKYKKTIQKNTTLALKNYSLPVLGGLATVYSSIQLFQTGNPYDIFQGSMSLISGLVLPLAETTMVLLAELEICAAAGPLAPYVAVVAVCIDVALIVVDLIKKAIDRHKLAKQASEFVADGYTDLINDLKDSFADVDDLYISGRFSGVPADNATTTDVFSGVSSWLYQALDNSAIEQSIEDIVQGITEDEQALSVQEFIDQLLDGAINAVTTETQDKFEDIYDKWTDGEEGVTPPVDVDLISDSSIDLDSNDLRESLQQFIGERLDDGGMQEDSNAVFTAGEALALDGKDMASYTRGIAIYGTDTYEEDEDGEESQVIREEIQTGSGNDVILLGLGEFDIKAGEGNNTIYISSDFKDITDAHDQSKYSLDAGDIEESNIAIQQKKDSDTLVIDGSAHINLTRLEGINMAEENTRQAIMFQGGESNKPLLVKGLENVNGSEEDDTMVSNASKCSTLTANAGDNILVTGYGVATNDGALNLVNSLKGGSGSDKLYGAHAGGEGYTSLTGGTGGKNLLIAGAGVNMLRGGPGNDILVSEVNPDKADDNIFILGFGDGSDRIEKGLNTVNVSLTDDGTYSNGISFEYGEAGTDPLVDSGRDYNYGASDPVITDVDNVRDILQFGEGVSAFNLRVSVSEDAYGRKEPNSDDYITEEVTFSLIADDTRVLDALIGEDLSKPNLQTGDSITIKGNWSNLTHRLRMLRFADGSSLNIAKINNWNTSATTRNDHVVLNGQTFFQGFCGNDTIKASGGDNVILPGSGHNTVLILGADDQVLINRNPLNQDTIYIDASAERLTVVLDGTIRLRDLGVALNGSDLTLTMGEGGNRTALAQNLVIINAIGKLLLQFGSGFTLDLTALALDSVLEGGNGNDTLDVDSGGPAILLGGFGNDRLYGAQTGPCVFIPGAGSDAITASQDNSDDLYILQDCGGIDSFDSSGADLALETISNKTILMVNTNPEFDASRVLKRDDIWFATKGTVSGLADEIDQSQLPQELLDLESGDLLIWIRGQSNGCVISAWDKWDGSNKLVVANPYEGAFEIDIDGINSLLPIMDRFINEEDNSYSPWHPDLGNEDETISLNVELSEAILEQWTRTTSVFKPGV